MKIKSAVQKAKPKRTNQQDLAKAVAGVRARVVNLTRECAEDKRGRDPRPAEIDAWFERFAPGFSAALAPFVSRFPSAKLIELVEMCFENWYHHRRAAQQISALRRPLNGGKSQYERAAARLASACEPHLSALTDLGFALTADQIRACLRPVVSPEFTFLSGLPTGEPFPHVHDAPTKSLLLQLDRFFRATLAGDNLIPANPKQRRPPSESSVYALLIAATFGCRRVTSRRVRDARKTKDEPDRVLSDDSVDRYLRDLRGGRNRRALGEYPVYSPRQTPDELLSSRIAEESQPRS